MLPTVYKKTLNCIENNSWMSSTRVTFNLTCGKGVTELQNLTNLHVCHPLQKFTRCNRRILMSPLKHISVFFSFHNIEIKPITCAKY